ncbi:MAG: tripartite tricarboxylate transporter TctB family protein [Ruminococcaceae bacterium]|nr:tripartite tricarboxylate transporter TctB family protein [Oscillospiraceae bacterium]
MSPVKMKKTDIGVVAFMYAVCAFFYVYSFDLSDSSKAYPRFTIVLLFGLTTLYLVQMVLRARKFGVESGVDEVFEGFQPKQFFISFALVIVYFFMIKYLGFFSATTIYLVAALVYLRVPVVHSAITVVGVDVMIYLAFVLFLGVKLPKGLLF